MAPGQKLNTLCESVGTDLQGTSAEGTSNLEMSQATTTHSSAAETISGSALGTTKEAITTTTASRPTMECVVKIEEAPLPAVPLPDALAGARSLTSSEAPPLALSLPGDDAPTRELRVATEASEEAEASMKDEDAVGYLSGDGDGEASVGPEVVDGKDGGRKEKAVKVKKIFLRILRKVMDVPQDSPLLRVWRSQRMAKKSGKQLPEGWYGIEVMDVEEVDSTLLKLIPNISPSKVGNQDPRTTISEILEIDQSVSEQYITLKKGRYRLNEQKLDEQGHARVAKLRSTAKRLHAEILNAASQGTQRAAPPPPALMYPGSYYQPPYNQPQAASMARSDQPQSSAHPVAARAAAAPAPRDAASQLQAPGMSIGMSGAPSAESQGGQKLSQQAAALLARGSRQEGPAPPPLRCLDCAKVIPCSCPFNNRLVMFPDSTYQDAMNMNKIGENFQSMWELADVLPMQALEDMTRRFGKVVNEVIEAVESPTLQRM
eukprot:CAMPEP_0114297162 /NCGR_PEP_ID=MMETSP0059-20121206/11708_1 /TAXON_ID=36894 /ORGANISM="Pyramimonas parkeae, Strain CCMP726" /LENGTH=488 /DNA_ID=CAMNT_0001419379 /DNA_START=408 /DNA_END=1874 /DNA_ORIENTATION=-